MFHTQGLSRLWHRYIASGDMTTVLITLVLLLMPALALQAAEWPLSLSITVPTMIISVLFGYLLSRSSYNELFALIISGVYGLLTVLVIAALSQPGGIVDRFAIVLARTLQWVIDAATGGINQDNLIFTLVVATLFWFFGYNATWHIFRVDHVWRVIVPPAMILMVNMIVYSGDANLDIYLLIFIFMALLLIVRSNLEAREWDWYVNGVQVPRKVRQQFMWLGSAISLFALLLAWNVPSTDLQERLDNFQRFLAAEPLQQMSEFWNRLIEPVESQGPATTDYYGGDSLELGGAIQLGDQVIMVVEADPVNRYYWRSRIFENYDGSRWRPSATRRVPDFDTPLEVNQAPEMLGAARQPVSHTVTMNTPSRIIYTAPQPLRVDLPGRLDVFRTNGNQDDSSSPINLSAIRPQRVVERGQSYQATGALSTATAFDLRAAGTDYPEWIALPNTSTTGINGRVAQLARQIVDDVGASNPYDQAKAIETWLRREIQYNETIPTPPDNVDPIEWFLFELKQGYCTYYATGMVTMLRSLGIPARMAAGFFEGEYDAELGQYVVRERDAHTWVEVYFPGFGWVEFEPTAARAPLNRNGDTVQQVQQPFAPAATNEPTQTPTPLPSPTPLPTSTPADPQQQQQAQPDSPPTATPTPSPTPTATPVIVPTVAPPVQPPQPPPANFLSFLLPAIGTALLIMGTVVSLVLLSIFIWWWWEWRGMGGLSPVARAYARLERYLILIGWRSPDSSTPEERRAEIVQQLPRVERPVTAITRAYTVERYSHNSAGTPQSARHAQIADNAWSEARTNIVKRWLRRFIPFLKN